MGVFGSITPVITLGSISKRWIVPGWRLGWLVTNDTNGILKEQGVFFLFLPSLTYNLIPPSHLSVHRVLFLIVSQKAWFNMMVISVNFKFGV